MAKEVQPGGARPDCYQASVKELFIPSHPSLILLCLLRHSRHSTSRRGPENRAEPSGTGPVVAAASVAAPSQRWQRAAQLLRKRVRGTHAESWGESCKMRSVQSHNILSQHAPRQPHAGRASAMGPRWRKPHHQLIASVVQRRPHGQRCSPCRP